jgi:acyl carrier protein
MLEIIAFLESEFGIRISDSETTPENLESIARIAAFVGRKQGKSAA